MKKIIFFIFAALLFACGQEIPKEVTTTPVDFCSSIHCEKQIGLSAIDSLTNLYKNKTGVCALEDGGGSMVARAWLCENAQSTIDVQYFIFSTDNVGLIAVDYLVHAADRGVKVRILIDDIMVEADEEQLLTLDSHENISVKIYNPSINIGKNVLEKIGSLDADFRGANQRMHNKTFTVDGKVVITGGRNIADEYFDFDHEYNFRDRDVLLIGGAVKNVASSFEQFWNSGICKDVLSIIDATKYKLKISEQFKMLHEYACDSNNFWPQVRNEIKNIPQTFEAIQKSGRLQWVDSINFVSDLPGKNDGTQGLEGGGATTTALMELVKNAKHSIVIQTPYLITTDLGKNLFKEATARGVEIKIMTNSLASTDNVEAFSGYQRDRMELLKTGVRVFEYKPDAAIRKSIMTGALQKKIDFTPIFGLHAKSMVIDGEITVIGTFNLDPRSANLNTECVTIIYSPEITKGVLKGMEEELKPENCWETTYNFNPDNEAGVKKNLKAGVVKVIPKGIL